jgi:arginase family enzyme
LALSNRGDRIHSGKQEFQDVASGRPVYLSWDIDGFDPLRGARHLHAGLGRTNGAEGIELLRSLSGLNIVAMDFNTVSPPQDVNGMASHLCARMMIEALVLLTAKMDLRPG